MSVDRNINDCVEICNCGSRCNDGSVRVTSVLPIIIDSFDNNVQLLATLRMNIVLEIVCVVNYVPILNVKSYILRNYCSNVYIVLART